MTVIRLRNSVLSLLQVVVIVVLTSACSLQSTVRRTLDQVGAGQLRNQVMKACRDGFAAGVTRKIPETQWPEVARTFRPMGLWAEPDGAYLLLDTDPDGERGIYFPRILSGQEPICGPTIKHEKLAAGVYWYDRKRS